MQSNNVYLIWSIIIQFFRSKIVRDWRSGTYLVGLQRRTLRIIWCGLCWRKHEMENRKHVWNSQALHRATCHWRLLFAWIWLHAWAFLGLSLRNQKWLVWCAFSLRNWSDWLGKSSFFRSAFRYAQVRTWVTQYKKWTWAWLWLLPQTNAWCEVHDYNDRLFEQSQHSAQRICRRNHESQVLPDQALKELLKVRFNNLSRVSIAWRMDQREETLQYLSETSTGWMKTRESNAHDDLKGNKMVQKVKQEEMKEGNAKSSRIGSKWGWEYADKIRV